jgi:hypothetical protein
MLIWDVRYGSRMEQRSFLVLNGIRASVDCVRSPE